MMKDYVIDVGIIEELQMVNDTQALDTIFQRAKTAVVCGASAKLARKDASGKHQQFDTFTTPEDLEAYRLNVYKYLDTDKL
jgi:hypothetical protein